MLMTSLRYNKSVYMDFRLTACSHTTLCWSSDKLRVLCCATVIDFAFCTWWFSGPFRGKLAQKGHTPFKIYRIQTSQPARKQTNARSKKVGKVQTLSVFCSLEIQVLRVVVFSGLFAFITCLQGCVYDTIDSPCSNPVTQLIARQLCAVCRRHWVITLSLPLSLSLS